MNNENKFDEILLEWEGSLPIFDEAPLLEDSEEKNQLEARLLLSSHKTDLQDMITRFSASLGIATTTTHITNPFGKAILAFCIISLLNPLKVKILSGKGIDPILEKAELDDETGERKIKLREFLIFCKEADIPDSILSWLEGNGFCYTKDEDLIFRNSFKRGKIISKNK